MLSRQLSSFLQCIHKSWTTLDLAPLHLTSTPDFHQRGDQINAQDHYVVGQAGLLNSQFSYKRFDADVTAQSNDPSRLLLEPKAVSSIGRRVELPAPACRKLIS
jgi:hypothetical protein